MTGVRVSLLAAALLCAVQVAAAEESIADDATLVSGPGVVVTPHDLRLELRMLSSEQRRQVLETRAEQQNTVTRLYFRRRMTELAEEQGYLDDELVQARLRHAREQLLAQLVPQRFVEQLEMPDFTQEARDYYEANIEEFTPEEQIRAGHILLQAPTDADRERRRPEAEALLERLRDGEDFGELAHDHSEDGSRFMDGDLGHFNAGHMVPEFSEAAFALTEPGELSGVVETRFGLHIIKLFDRPSTEPRPFAEVEEQILERLRRDYRQEELSAWLRSAASPTEASVDDEAMEQVWNSLRDEFGVEAPPQEAPTDPESDDTAQDDEGQ